MKSLKLNQWKDSNQVISWFRNIKEGSQGVRCVRIVRFLSFYSLYFPTLGLNTETYRVNAGKHGLEKPCIRKILTQWFLNNYIDITELFLSITENILEDAT